MTRRHERIQAVVAQRSTPSNAADEVDDSIHCTCGAIHSRLAKDVPFLLIVDQSPADHDSSLLTTTDYRENTPQPWFTSSVLPSGKPLIVLR